MNRYYPDEATIVNLLDEHLQMIAPATERFHFHHEPVHDHAFLTVCAYQGMQRLAFQAEAYRDHVFTGRFNYFGTGGCSNHTGIDARVELLMERYPDAHIQFLEDEDEDLFGYVAYDEEWKVIGWAPIEDGTNARLTSPPRALQEVVTVMSWRRVAR